MTNLLSLTDRLAHRNLRSALNHLHVITEGADFNRPKVTLDSQPAEDYNWALSFRSLVSEKSKPGSSFRGDTQQAPQASTSNFTPSQSQYLTVSQNRSQMVSDQSKVLENLNTISRVNFQKVRRNTAKLINKMDLINRSQLNDAIPHAVELSVEFQSFCEYGSDFRFRKNDTLWEYFGPKFRRPEDVACWSERGVEVPLDWDGPTPRKHTHQQFLRTHADSVDHTSQGLYMTQEDLLLLETDMSAQKINVVSERAPAYFPAEQTFGPKDFGITKRKTSAFPETFKLTDSDLLAPRLGGGDAENLFEATHEEIVQQAGQLNDILNSSGIGDGPLGDITLMPRHGLEGADDFVSEDSVLPQGSQARICFSMGPAKPREAVGPRQSPDFLSIHSISARDSNLSYQSLNDFENDYSNKNKRLRDEVNDLFVSQAIRKVTTITRPRQESDDNAGIERELILRYETSGPASDRDLHFTEAKPLRKRTTLSLERDYASSSASEKANSQTGSPKQQSQRIVFESSFRKIEINPARRSTNKSLRQSKRSSIKVRDDFKNMAENLLKNYPNLSSLDTILASRSNNSVVSRLEGPAKSDKEDSFIKIEVNRPQKRTITRTRSSVGIQAADPQNIFRARLKSSKSRDSLFARAAKVQTEVAHIVHQSLEGPPGVAKGLILSPEEFAAKIRNFDNESAFQTWLFYRKLKQKLFIDRHYSQKSHKRGSLLLHIIFQNKALVDFFHFRLKAKISEPVRLADKAKGVAVFWEKAVKKRQLETMERVRVFGAKMTEAAKFFKHFSFLALKKEMVLHTKMAFLAEKLRWRERFGRGAAKIRSLFLLRSRLALFTGFYGLFGNSLADNFTGRHLPKNFDLTIVRQRWVNAERNLNFSVFSEQLGNAGEHLSEINLSKMLQSFNQNMQVFLQNIAVRNSRIVEVSSVLKEKRGSGLSGSSVLRSDVLASRYDPGVYVDIIEEVNEAERGQKSQDGTAQYEVFTSDSEKKMDGLISEKETRTFFPLNGPRRTSTLTGRTNQGSLSDSKRPPRKVSNGFPKQMMPLKQEVPLPTSQFRKRSEGGVEASRRLNFPSSLVVMQAQIGANQAPRFPEKKEGKGDVTGTIGTLVSQKTLKTPLTASRSPSRAGGPPAGSKRSVSVENAGILPTKPGSNRSYTPSKRALDSGRTVTARTRSQEEADKNRQAVQSKLAAMFRRALKLRLLGQMRTAKVEWAAHPTSNILKVFFRRMARIRVTKERKRLVGAVLKLKQGVLRTEKLIKRGTQSKMRAAFSLMREKVAKKVGSKAEKELAKTAPLVQGVKASAKKADFLELLRSKPITKPDLSGKIEQASGKNMLSRPKAARSVFPSKVGALAERS